MDLITIGQQLLSKILALDWPVPETVCNRHYIQHCLKEEGFGRKTGFAVNLASHLKSALNLFWSRRFR